MGSDQRQGIPVQPLKWCSRAPNVSWARAVAGVLHVVIMSPQRELGGEQSPAHPPTHVGGSLRLVLWLIRLVELAAPLIFCHLQFLFMSPQRELGGAQPLAHPADSGTLAKLFRLFRPWGWHSSVSMYHLWWRHVGWNDSPTTTCITARYCA